MMNSLKSVCSFAKGTPLPLYNFQEHREPVLRCKLGIELIIRTIGIFEATEHLNNAVHGVTLACAAIVHHGALPTGRDTMRVVREYLLACRSRTKWNRRLIAGHVERKRTDLFYRD